MALNTVDVGAIMSVPSTFAAYETKSPTPSIASGISSYVYNGGMVQADLTKIYGGSPTVAPAESSSFWDNIAQGANAAASVINAGKSLFTAPGTTIVSGSSPSSSAPISVGSGQPQAAPVLNIAVPGQGAQGSQATSAGLGDMTTWLVLGGLLLLMAMFVGRR